MTASFRVSASTRRILGTLAWFLIIVVISFGAAGLVTGMNHQGGAADHTELTFAGDAKVTPLLDHAEGDLVSLADQVEALGTQARGALAALNGANASTVDAAMAEGDRLVTDLASRTAALRQELGVIPYVGTPGAALAVSGAVDARHTALVAALDATDGLDLQWARLSVGSVAASRMSAILAEHDRLAGMAALRGRQARYKDAATFLDGADAQIAAARALRDQLANTVDVSVLDEWLDRNATYDKALRNLYVQISKVGRKTTDGLLKAIAEEKAAAARLPPDTRGLVIIMAEIGRGGMNGAVIAIEEARGKLSAAIDAADADPSSDPGASPGP
jgi:hypothetical protein